MSVVTINRLISSYFCSPNFQTTSLVLSFNDVSVSMFNVVCSEVDDSMSADDGAVTCVSGIDDEATVVDAESSDT